MSEKQASPRPGEGFRGLFGRPQGLLGWLAGWAMAGGNAEMNRFAVDMLEVQKSERVLEVGFGPGVALGEIARVIGNGFAAGIERSPTMVRQASGRLRQRIGQGYVELKEGTAESVPYSDASFDRVLSVNTIYFWPDPRPELREMRRVLRPGGVLVLCFRGAVDEQDVLRIHGMPGSPSVVQLGEWVRGCGFDGLRTRTRELRRGWRTITAVALAAEAV